MPSDFNIAAYDAVYLRMNANSYRTQDTFDPYIGAWKGVAYRFLSCAESDVAFTTSLRERGPAPSSLERYRQERELFYFFVAGLASIENLCFALFAMGSMLDPHIFAMRTDKHLGDISPESTKDKFAKFFRKKGLALTLGLSETLKQLTGADEFKEWKKIRNILAHRANPGRDIPAGKMLGTEGEVITELPRPSRPRGGTRGAILRSTPPPTLWKVGIELNEHTTSSRRQWLAEKLDKLLNDTDAFTANCFP
jgi:hypothetical protein